MATYSNTLVINRPTQNAMQSAQCDTQCSGLGHADPLDKHLLGPRPKREKVREQIRDYILNMLGAPVIKIELDEQNVDFCIEQALKIFEDYAPAEYFQYYTFRTSPGKSVYEMPPEVGYVRDISYMKQGQFAFQASDLQGAIPIEYFYPGGSYASIQGGMIDPVQPIWGRMGEWVLYKSYEQMYTRVSSALGGWEWIGGYSTIKLYPIPYRSTTVVVRYLQKMKDWPMVTQAMQEGALAYAKIILGRIRSKYRTQVGPGGGTTLDGEALLQEGNEELKEWKKELIYRYGDILPILMD